MTVDKTIEIWNKALHFYHGNYEKYLTQKEERASPASRGVQEPA